MTQAFRRYAELLDKLFWRRATGKLSDDQEEWFAEALNDCRSGMSAGEEDKLTELIAKKRLTEQRQLNLTDTNPTHFPRANPQESQHG